METNSVDATVIEVPRRTRLSQTAAALGHPVPYGQPMLAPQIGLYRADFGLGLLAR
jgi:hypothetical protein